MITGGNTKQRACFYASIAFCVAALLSVVAGNAMVAAFLLLAGVIFGLGIWTMGLTKAEDPHHAEAMNAIR